MHKLRLCLSIYLSICLVGWLTSWLFLHLFEVKFILTLEKQAQPPMTKLNFQL